MLEPGPNTMMLVYDERGFACQTVEWPFPQGMAEAFEQHGMTWVLAPKQWPDGNPAMIWDFWVDINAPERRALFREDGPWIPSAPEPLLANGVDAFKLENLPVGAVVRVGAAEYTVDESGEVELTSSTPVTMIVKVEYWPYQDSMYEVIFE